MDDVQSPLWSKSVRLITKPLVRGQYYHLIEAPLVSFKNIRVQVMSEKSLKKIITKHNDRLHNNRQQENEIY